MPSRTASATCAVLAIDKTDIDVGIGAAEGEQMTRQPVAGDGLARLDAQASALEARELHHRLLGAFGARKHGRGFGEQQPAGVGQLDAAADAIEEMGREMRFEMGDGRARGGLRKVERFGAAGDVALLRDRDEDAQLFQRQPHLTPRA